jgi:META domain
MPSMLRRTAAAIVVIGAAAIMPTTDPQSAPAQGAFPYEHELILDARPLPGSRRVPMLEIFPSGRAQVDLWCKSGIAQVEVMGSAIKFTLGEWREQACRPERARRDDEMIEALSQVTSWRQRNDVVTFSGGPELRFRLSTH